MNALSVLRTRWQGLSPRERRIITLAAVLLGPTLLWTMVMRPAWHTWQQAPVQRELLAQQWQSMLQLQAETTALRAQPAPDVAQLERSLRLSLSPFGTGAQLEVNADQLLVRFKQIPATDLARWLGTLRQQTRLQPTQAQLRQDAESSTANSATSTAAPARWSGTLQFRLPPATRP